MYPLRCAAWANSRDPPNAVAAYQSGFELEEVPLGTSGFKYILRIDAHPVEYLGQLVHEGNVDIALGVLDHLGGFGHLDAGAKWVPAEMTEEYTLSTILPTSGYYRR